MPAIATIGDLWSERDGVPQLLPGFHVNSTGRLRELDAYLVEPATPLRSFDGAQTWCYVFDDQAQAEQLLAGVDLSDLPSPAVRSISRRQGRTWLLRQGLLPQVEALVAAGDAELRIWWEDSSEFHLGNPVLQAVFTQLGMPIEQLPAAFLAASQL